MNKALKNAENEVVVVGAGLAGCEAAWVLSNHKINVKLFEMKPKKFSKAHKSPYFAELVCSNSFKSKNITSASGMLKKEMEIFNSLTLQCAKLTEVAAGNALAVDRTLFSKEITKRIKSRKNITIINEELTKIPKGTTIIATGPLTSKHLTEEIINIIKDFSSLYFYDAIAPIIYAKSVDMDYAFFSSRYDQTKKDYLNCPMNESEYNLFYEALICAKQAKLHPFDSPKVYEGCMPIEIMAKRGKDTMRFGPLKPVGIVNPKTKERYFSIVQLRKENLTGDFFNMVGFQTNLTYSEQKKVFCLIPALKNAEFLRFGSMHKNIFINSPTLLQKDLSLKNNNNIFFAGQITGVEGYLESAAMGILAGHFVLNKLQNKTLNLPKTSIMASLLNYITNKNNATNFQPMSANFGLLPVLKTKIKNKKERQEILALRGIYDLQHIVENIT